jgi:hypothetical protein
MLNVFQYDNLKMNTLGTDFFFIDCKAMKKAHDKTSGCTQYSHGGFIGLLKGTVSSHEKVGEMRVEGDGL